MDFGNPSSRALIIFSGTDFIAHTYIIKKIKKYWIKNFLLSLIMTYIMLVLFSNIYLGMHSLD